MGTIVLSIPVADTEITAGLHASNYNALQTLLNGNLDNTNISGSATLNATARIGVRKNSAGSVFSRRRLNLIEGTGITLTVADDSGNEEVDITIASAATEGNPDPLVGYPRNSGHSAITANSAYLTAFTMHGPGTISGVWVNIGVSAGNIDAGIYDNAGNRVVSKGSTASPGTGWQEYTFTPTLLAAGEYWLAVSGNNAALTLGQDGTSRDLRVQRVVASSFPLPATIVLGSTRPSNAITLSAEVT